MSAHNENNEPQSFTIWDALALILLVPATIFGLTIAHAAFS